MYGATGGSIPSTNKERERGIGMLPPKQNRQTREDKTGFTPHGPNYVDGLLILTYPAASPAPRHNVILGSILSLFAPSRPSAPRQSAPGEMSAPRTLSRFGEATPFSS